MTEQAKPSNEMVQRAELYRRIWRSLTRYRESSTGDFKQYILENLFYRFISENLTEYFNKEHDAGDLNVDYAQITDEEAIHELKLRTVEEKVFSFCRVNC